MDLLSARPSGPPPRNVRELYERLAARGPKPALVWYGRDDERVELSGRVLAMWAAKVAGFVLEELDGEDGLSLRIDLPPHWRSVAWALGLWLAGGHLVSKGDPDVVLTHEPTRLASATRTVAVATPLVALALAWPGELPRGVLDGAAEVAGYPDIPVWLPEVEDDRPAIAAPRSMSHAQVVARPAPSDALVIGEDTHTCILDAVSLLAHGRTAVLVAASITGADLDRVRTAESL